MPFNTLLLSGCFLPGKTSFIENGVEISLQPETGETVLFFSIDEQSNSNCKLRQLLEINKPGMKICDLIVFYARGEERTICFVELKGSDLKTAIEQVINTYSSFKSLLKTQNNLYTAKAFIRINNSPPRETDKYKQELISVFGESNYDISRSKDLGEFLRGVARQLKGKRKKGR
ncbi:hypothetical protein [Iningainema tapete]|uniref:Uncharacterized protein n=1 Tax=Iningainema tapete BLCC-T55 TaxID=2748662 RepID=A0A8J6XIV2_9CYAN|nr:hypothetical protein [Iningainema tapete]MBD2777665.1 hypothetical protein [Iningainema tapete BLCC-T55]